MKRTRRRKGFALVTRIWVPVLILAIAVFFFTALSNMSEGQSEEARQQLEDALRRTAVSCYAAEGVYPPTLEYMEEHYGLQIDRKRFTVHYEIFAVNIMPDITVLEKY